jgi:hypothetical protein
VQRFQVDGLSKEELKVLATLAGPKGLGLVDEAGQAMIEIIAEAGDILDITGDQSEIVSGLIIKVAEDITSVTGEAENLTAVLEEMTRDAWILRIEHDLFPRRAGEGGGGQRPTVQGPADPTEEDWWDVIRRSVVQSVVQSSPTVNNIQTNQGDNLNLTIHTSAPVEPIERDFRMMRAMQSRAS